MAAAAAPAPAPAPAPHRTVDCVLDLTKAAQEMGTDPLIWVMQLSSSINASGASIPSIEVAELLVSHICWSNNVPTAWKFLEKALTIRVAPPMLVLALLSIRVIPVRRRHPVAYRLYMELLKRYSFSLPSLINGPNYHKPMQWECFSQHLRLLAANSSSLRNSKILSPESLLHLTSDTHQILLQGCQTKSCQQFHTVMARSPLFSTSQFHGTVQSEQWLPVDLYLEDTMDGMQVLTSTAAETLAGLVKTLQVVNQTTWHDTFLGLWIAALRLVQRERNSSEGPVSRLDTCLCMLLSIVVLAVVHIIKEDEIKLVSETQRSSNNQRKDVLPFGKYLQDLVSSLQRLNNFEGLLCPPPLVSSLAK